MICSDNSKIELKVNFCKISAKIILVKPAHQFLQGNYLHAQRLQTLGMLSGGIAHDFNNVLAGILGHVTYLKAVLPKEGKHIESLEAIEEGSNKASLLTREIVNFSKLDENKAEYSEISDVINQTAKLIRGALPPKYKIELDLSDEPLVVGLSESNLAQIIVNLVMNARDAIVDQGIISVSVARSKLNDNTFCLLTVKDNGKGIPKSILDKVCNLYFSTKKEKGNGLGLATVSEIVSKSGGKLKIESKENVGTEIKVYLPLCGQIVEEGQEEERNEEDSLIQGSGKILVVDDEDSVRNVVCMSLEHVGYEVVAASSGQEALDEYKSANYDYDLLIIDMLMPGLSGEETFEELKALNPNVKALFISGYTSEASVENVLSSGGLGFLQKPFTIEQLTKKVVECM
jgi:two-component system cell cycle sensor histidine kinase/response regulator CckA